MARITPIKRFRFRFIEASQYCICSVRPRQTVRPQLLFQFQHYLPATIRADSARGHLRKQFPVLRQDYLLTFDLAYWSKAT